MPGTNPSLASALLCLAASLYPGALGGAGRLRPAQAQSQAPSPGEKIGWVPVAILERPVPLRGGIGNLHEKVTTSSPQAQKYYDQGLDYLYAYVWIEAARSFHQALRADPNLAMAYVGLSEVYVELQDDSAARIACQKAQSLSSQASEGERRRIAIQSAELDFIADPSSMPKYFAWRKAISDALLADPEDWDLWILRGFAEQGTPGALGQGGNVDTIADYETALAFSPDNSAAHHFLAHSFENLPMTHQALVQAEAFARLAPSIPHAHHMVGHELRRLGRTTEAIQEFREAGELEAAYYRTEKIPAKYDWMYSHNLSMLALCYEALGRMKAAEPLLRNAFSLPAYTDVAEYNRREWPDFLRENGRPEEALRAAREMIENSYSRMGRLAGHVAAGSAWMALHRTDEANNELQLADQEWERLPPRLANELPDPGILWGEVALEEHKQAEADAAFKKAEALLEALPGPDDWSESLFDLQFIARVAREHGDWNLAQFTARQMIAHDPSYAGGYYALGLAQQHAGDGAAARQQFALAAKLWSGADPDLPELLHLQQELRDAR